MTAALETKPTLEGIFRDHLAFLWRILRYMGVPDADREDVAQDVLLVVQVQLRRYEERGALRSWLYAITRRVVADHRHRARFRNEMVRDVLPEVGKDEQGRLEARSHLSRLDDALDLVSPDQRRVFLLYEVEGMSMPEIADALGAPLQTCYSRLNAARTRVTEAFATEEAG